MSKEILTSMKPIIDANHFPNFNGVVISEVEEDEAFGYVELNENSMNSYGICHGGCYFTLADTTAGIAARSNGEMYVTESANMNFIKAAKGTKIISHAKVINRGKNICLLECTITDELDNLLCKGTFSYFNIEAK